jgi:hypothetical protein
MRAIYQFPEFHHFPSKNPLLRGSQTDLVSEIQSTAILSLALLSKTSSFDYDIQIVLVLPNEETDAQTRSKICPGAVWKADRGETGAMGVCFNHLSNELTVWKGAGHFKAMHLFHKFLFSPEISSSSQRNERKRVSYSLFSAATFI